MASMLDMAFQLLTFFILTFRPPPLEGQISLRLPPPQMASNLNGKNKAGDENKTPVDIKGVNTLVITVFATPNGELDGMGVGEERVKDLDALNQKLKTVFSDANNPYEQVILQASPSLHYGELTSVVDVCARQELFVDGVKKKLEKLSFVELADNPGK
jgi:biopolymer transport protein ExbD